MEWWEGGGDHITIVHCVLPTVESARSKEGICRILLLNRFSNREPQLTAVIQAAGLGQLTEQDWPKEQKRE